jgi:hypothetical protein
MAEETVDALVLTTRFDESGLDRSAQQQIAGLQQFVNQINRTAEGIEPVEFDVSAIAAGLEAAGGDVSAFFAGIQEGVNQGVADFQRLAQAAQQVRPPDTVAPAAGDAATQQLRILAALEEEQRQLEASVGDLTSATAALEAEETALAASMARQSQAAAQAGAAATVQAQEVLRAQQQLAQAQRLAAAVGQEIVAPSVRLDPNVARLAQGYIQTTQAAQRLAQAQIGLARTTDPVAAGMARASAGANAWAQGLANVQRAQAGATSAAVLSGRGFNKLENALTGILLASGGVPPALSGIANALIGLGVNSVPVLGVLAAAAAIAGAYAFLTRSAREAQAATEDFVRSMVSASQGREDPFERLRRNMEGVPDEIEGTTNALRRLNEQLAKGQEQPFLFNLIEFNALRGGIAAIEREIRDVERATQEAQLQVVEATRSRVEGIVNQRLEAEREGVQAELRIQQAGFRLREQQLRAAFEAEEVTREEFFGRRIALAREGAAAEVAALRAERETVAATAVAADQEAAQQAKIASLDAAIRLRQAELGIQLDQIEAEEARGRAQAALLPIQRQLADLQARRQEATAAGIGSVEFDTSQAEAQLDTLETQIQGLAAFAEQRPDLGFDTSDARAGLDQLRAQLAEVIRAGADADTRLEFDTSLASAQLDALEAQARRTFLTARTEAERELALQAVVTVRTQRIELFQREVQRQLDALQFSVDLTADTTGVEREVRERLGIPIPVELDTQAAIAEAQRLRDEIGRRIAAAGGQAQAAPVDVQAFEQLTQAIQEALNAPFRALLQGAETAREALASSQAAIEAERALLAGAGDPGAGAADMAAALARVEPLVTAIGQRYAEVTAQIAAGTGNTEETIALLREQAALAEDLRRIEEQRAAAVPGELVGNFAPLEAATQAFIQAQRQLRAAQAAGAEGAAREAATNAERAADQMERQRDEILAVAEGLNLSEQEATALYEALARSMAVLEGGVTDAQRFARALDNALGVLGAIQRFGGATGIFSESDQRFLDALGGIGNTVGQFASGNIFGGIISAIDTLGGLFGGGPSPIEIALRNNEEAIRQNTIARTQGFEGLGGAADAANIIAQVLGSARGAFAADTTQVGGGLGRQSRAELVAMMEDLGLSFEQLQRLADEFGIEILVNGNLVGDALAQLEEEMRAAAQAAFDFSAGLFTDQQTLENLRSRALGTDQDPMEIFRQQLEAAGNVGAGELFQPLEDALQTGDAVNIRQAILAMLDAWENNLIDIEGLGGLTREQWEEILRSGLDAADAIDQLAESTDAATRAMINVPQGFRAAQIAFEAQDPNQGITGPWRPITGPLVPVAGDGAALPDLTAAVEKVAAMRPLTVTGPIYVDARDKTAKELFDLISEEAARHGSAGAITFQTRPG